MFSQAFQCFTCSPVNKGRKKANVGTNSNKAGFFPDVRL